MFYSDYGNFSVDSWREEVSSSLVLNSSSIAIAIARASGKQVKKDSKLVPTIAGFVAVGAVYTAATALVLVDGPLPFGDAIAAGLIAIPDAVIFHWGYSLFD